MARVELDRVNKIYRGRGIEVHAVRDLSLAIEDGEFVAILGPSGCGKTSTLRMIVGLEDITGGEIRFDGRRVNELGPEARNVAMAFETYALYPTFTVFENLAFPLEVRGLERARIEREVREIARLLEIEDILGQKPGQLSGGQQQRVSLGRALVREPAVFILDEVMSHLDAHLKFRMLFELKRLHQRLGRTMVYVTHDQVEALALADRVAVMSNAELQQFADRDALYNRPANRFVADFIGEPPTNFFDARVVGEGEEVRLVVNGTGLAFRPDGQRRAVLARSGAREVTVGIRPQNLGIEPPDGACERIEAEVDIFEYLGETAILALRSGERAFRAVASPRHRYEPGTPLSLFYRPRDVMLFDPATGDFLA